MHTNLKVIIVRSMLLAWLSICALPTHAVTEDELKQRFEEAQQLSEKDPEKALVLVKSVIDSAKKMKNHAFLVQSHVLAAQLSASQSRYFDALRFIDAARKALPNQDEISELSLYVAIEKAYILDNIGDYNAAVKLLRELTKNAAELKAYRALMSIQNFLGMIYTRMGLHELALEQYHELLKNLETHGREDKFSIVYNNIGATHFEMENNMEALRYLKLAEGGAGTQTSPVREQQRKINIASIYVALDQLDKAKQTIDEAKALNASVDNEFSKSMLQIVEANWNLKRGDSESAESLLEQTLSDDQNVQHHDIVESALRILIKLKQQQGDYEAALNYLKRKDEQRSKSLEIDNVTFLTNMEQLFSESVRQHHLTLIEKEKERVFLELLGLVLVAVIAAILLFILQRQVSYRKTANELTQRYHEYLRSSKINDAISGLLNRRGMTLFWKDLLSESEVTDKPFTLAVIGIDEFAEELQTRGKRVADQALRYVADFIKPTIRKPNAAARWFEDRFLLLFAADTDIDINSALMHIQEKLKKQPFTTEDISITLSLSIGVAQGSGDPYEVLDRADRGQFKASQQGDQCVFVEA